MTRVGTLDPHQHFPKVGQECPTHKFAWRRLFGPVLRTGPLKGDLDHLAMLPVLRNT